MFNTGHNSVFFPQAFQLPALRPTAQFQRGCPSGELGEPGQRWGPAVPPGHLPWWSMLLLLLVPSWVRCTNPLKETLAWREIRGLAALLSPAFSFFVIWWWFIPLLLNYCTPSGVSSPSLHEDVGMWMHISSSGNIRGYLPAYLTSSERGSYYNQILAVPFNQIWDAFFLWLTASFFRSKGFKMHCIQAPVF